MCSTSAIIPIIAGTGRDPGRIFLPRQCFSHCRQEVRRFVGYDDAAGPIEFACELDLMIVHVFPVAGTPRHHYRHLACPHGS